jgi:hypothetical protein
MNEEIAATATVVAETLESVIQERNRLRTLLSGAWLRHRPPGSLAATMLGVSESAGEVDDAVLIERIRSAFQRAVATPLARKIHGWLAGVVQGADLA